jgi:hypothetical protein
MNADSHEQGPVVTWLLGAGNGECQAFSISISRGCEHEFVSRPD